MGREFIYLTEKLIALALLCTMCGCRGIFMSVRDLFIGEQRVDPEMVAKYWDGPKIGPGMNLNISVGSVTTPMVSMSVLVDQKGEITLPHLVEKPVKCDGMTLEELKSALNKEYSNFYRQPKITVTFGTYDGHGVSPWGTVTVMGEVGTQGPVNMPPTMDLTVTKVLQLAGGLKPYADKTSIRVTRCDKEGRQTRIEVDLREIGEEGRFDKDILLKAGDVVYVPETWY